MTKLQLYILHISIFCSICYVAYALPDADLPIQINADQASFDHKEGLATYEGHVIVNQGTRNLQANKLTIHRDTNNRIKLMVATGKPATFKSLGDAKRSPGSGTANIIKYYPQLDKVDLINNASLTQNGDTVSGPKLSYNFVTEVLQGKSTNNQRTTVILQPKRVQ